MPPVDWEAEPWGGRVHVAADCPDSHTTTEDDAERRNS